MALVNEHFLKLPGSYLFSDIAKKVNTFRITHPKQEVIRLGIGDVTRPLPPACIEAMHRAVDEMTNASTFHGYGPEQGYDFLIEAIIKHDYAPRGIHFSPTEVFVNDGAKSDTGNIGDILRHDNSVGVTDPIYPVYIDSNVMCGRAGVLEEDGKWSNVTYMPCTAENNFVPEIPDKRIDIVYLCYPNNPTGTTLTKSQLKKWVDYALANDTLILFDAAYEAFIQEEDVPHSIYEIKGAKKCAIEFRSFSKTAGFTGVRCGYTVVPKELTAATLTGERIPLNRLWNRRQCTKFNGTSYITQRAAEAIYTGRQAADKGKHRLLYEQRPNHERGSGSSRTESVRRCECSLHLAKSTEWHRFLALLRTDVIRSQCSRNTRRRFRPQRRRLHPPDRLRESRRLCGSHEANQKMAGMKMKKITTKIKL